MIPVSALQPDPIKGSHTIPMFGSWSSATSIHKQYGVCFVPPSLAGMRTRIAHSKQPERKYNALDRSAAMTGFVDLQMKIRVI